MWWSPWPPRPLGEVAVCGDAIAAISCLEALCYCVNRQWNAFMKQLNMLVVIFIYYFTQKQHVQADNEKNQTISILRFKQIH